MKITFLGTGTSTGVPEVGCKCEVCTSTNPKDQRLRSSALIEVDGKRILIDCGPDFRQQMMNIPFAKIDGVLLTHEHYDHVSGIDDLRPFCRFGDVQIYAERRVVEALKARIPYCFMEHKYPGVPLIELNQIEAEKDFELEGIQITPIRVMHNSLPIIGYRIGDFAYLTDIKYIPEEELHKLENLDTLVINALRHTHHIAHETLEEALVNIERIAPKKAYLTHMAHQIGLHDQVQKTLPKNVFLAYDGLEITIQESSYIINQNK